MEKYVEPRISLQCRISIAFSGSMAVGIKATVTNHWKQNIGDDR